MDFSTQYIVSLGDIVFGAFMLLIVFGIAWWGITSSIQEAISFFEEWRDDRRVAKERDNCPM
jgi:hypothetical protein